MKKHPGIFPSSSKGSTQGRTPGRVFPELRRAGSKNPGFKFSVPIRGSTPTILDFEKRISKLYRPKADGLLSCHLPL